MKSGAQFQLPTTRKKSFLEWVDQLNVLAFAGLGLFLYVGPVFIFSGIEYFIGTSGSFRPDQTVGFGGLLYFNFVSMLTIGYGDMSPLGVFRLITIIEAILGLAIYSFAISLLTIKLLRPGKDTIVFSKYAYYCTDNGAFMVIYLNTASEFVTNLETSWYFKLNEDWQTKPPVRVPFITTSVQTFYLDFEQSPDHVFAKLHPFDCLRVGLSGNVGMAAYSTYVQYDLEDIWVIRNRAELTGYEGFYKVDENLSKKEFQDYFHFKPKDAKNMIDFGRIYNKPTWAKFDASSKAR